MYILSPLVSSILSVSISILLSSPLALSLPQNIVPITIDPNGEAASFPDNLKLFQLQDADISKPRKHVTLNKDNHIDREQLIAKSKSKIKLITYHNGPIITPTANLQYIYYGNGWATRQNDISLINFFRYESWY